MEPHLNSELTENARLHAELLRLQKRVDYLEQSDRRFRTIFEQSPLSAMVISAEGRTLMINQAWVNLFEAHTPELKAYVLNEYSVLKDPLLDAEGVTPFIRAAIDGQPQIIPPLLYKPPAESGKAHLERWLGAMVAPVKDDDGKINEIILVHHDITAIKKAEEELRRSRDQLRVILEGVVDGITVVARDGKYIYANTAAARLCCMESAEELIYAEMDDVVNRFDIFDENGRPISVEDLPSTPAFRGVPNPPELMVRFKPKGGAEERWSIINSKPVFDDNGQVLFVVTIFRDYTERKKSEQMLRERESRFRMLAEASKALVTSLDYEGVLSTVAKLAVPEFADWAAVDLLGDDGQLRRSIVWHQNPARISQAEEFQRKYPHDMAADTPIVTTVKTGQSCIFESIPESLVRETLGHNPEKLADTLLLDVRSFITVPLRARDKILGALTFVFSESGRSYNQELLLLAEELGRRGGLAIENARLFQQAQKAIQLRDDFLSIAAHELRTPLTSLSMQLQILQRIENKAELAEKIGPKLEMALRQANSLARLIDRLLDLSRLANNRLAIEPEPVDLVKLAGLVVEGFRGAAKAAGSTLVFKHDVPELRGNWDQLRLEQALTNLLSNALKYGEGKPVEISVTSSEGVARVRFSDQGLGIAPADHDRIFGRFERAISHTDISGLGIGLYITRQIATAHGGDISVESTPGMGSVFTLSLPL